MKKLAIISVSGILLAFSLFAHAQYPEKPVRLLVGFVPGGGTDTSARILSEQLSTELGQAVVVENRPGASGLIAADEVANSKPDGYTLLLANMQSTVSAPHFIKKNAPEPLSKFSPVSFIGVVPNVLVISPEKHPFNNARELIDFASKNAGKLSYASSGLGGPQHLSAAQFAQTHHLTMTHVPYKGSGQAVTDLIGGLVDLNFDTLPGIISQVRAGKLKALAVTSSSRSAQLPDVPTIEEQGLPKINVAQWYGVLAPANVPAEIVKKIDSAISRSLENENVQKKLALQGLTIGDGPDSPESFKAMIAKEWVSYGDMEKAFNSQ
jgi:tripartite-type tricarboxylate transporter receptor subunit TctC